MNNTLFEVLCQAVSQDQNVLRTATATLEEWNKQDGFYTELFKVYADRSVPTNVRLVAILYLKNGVEKRWHQSQYRDKEATLDTGERNFIREQLLTTFDEPVNQLATQVAVVIGSIARRDYPDQWTSLFPAIVDAMHNENEVVQHRALLYLNQSIQELSTKVLFLGQKDFCDLSKDIFMLIIDRWKFHTETFFDLVINKPLDVAKIAQNLEKALLLSKTIKCILKRGVQMNGEHLIQILLGSFVDNFIHLLKICVSCRNKLASLEILVDESGKLTVNFVKILKLLMTHHTRWDWNIDNKIMSLAIYYCFTDEGYGQSFEKFIMQWLQILIYVIKPFGHWIEKALSNSQRQEREKYLSIFTPDVLENICTRLILQYFPLSEEELKFWESDPENYEIEKSTKTSNYSYRPNIKELFKLLFQRYKRQFKPLMISLMQKYHQPVDPNNLKEISRKDAVYYALGLVAWDLYEEVKFDQWFSTTLKLELQQKDGNYLIIRRRILWLIGKWAGLNTLSFESKPEAYRVLVEALHPVEHLSVRLTASSALKQSLNDFEFYTEQFLIYLEPAVYLLFTLVKEVVEDDTKMKVISVLNYLIDRVKHAIKPYIAQFHMVLPQIYQDADNHLLRGAVILMLTALGKALGLEGVELHPFMLDVVSSSVDPDRNEFIYLSLDASELWLVVLENAPAGNQAMMDLYKHVAAVFGNGAFFPLATKQCTVF